MQTKLPETYRQTPQGEEAEAILRSCVHCGFCTAVCPTYQLLGDELDSPRGRIYLIKSLLEGEAVGAQTQQHLDRCLTCRACETACPSGVQYARLADIGRHVVEQRVPRPLRVRWLRGALRLVLPHTRRFALMLGLGRWARPLLPAALKRRVPVPHRQRGWPPPRHARRVLIHAGCVQPALAPDIDAALARVLDRHGISAVPVASGCCGAVHQHLAAPDAALANIRTNIDAWWPLIEQGAEAIVETSSACGAMVREYGHLMRHDPVYASKAERIAAQCRDPAELLAGLNLEDVGRGRRIAFHAPCSLQNGLRLESLVERILRQSGFELLPVAESTMCCGAAGTYSILQPELSARLQERKLTALEQHHPEVIATANIGCLTHLQGGSALPVSHWLELLA